MTNGLPPTSDIDIAAIGTVPFGLSSVNPVFTRTFSIVIVTTYAALAQVVKARPHNVANDIGIVMHQFPVAEGIARITLRLPHHTLGVALMVAGVFVNHVVIATNVEHLEMRVVDLPVAVPGAEGLGHRTCVVNLLDGCLQLASCGDHADILTLDDLVADTPADDAGVVHVALYHRMDILTIARVDKRGVVVGVLLRAPSIEGLTNDEHTQRVAGIEEGSRGGVM